MSDMYAIKGSTLTAIGDAVRKQTGKSISVEEKGEPIHRITGYTTDLEFVGYDGIANRNWYIAPIDFRTMDIIQDAPKWYVEYYLESLDVAGPIDCQIKFLQNDTYTTAELFDSYRIISLCSISKGTPTASGNKSGNILDNYKKAYLMVGMRPAEDEQGQRVSYDIKIWPQDNSNKFIVKNTYTPLQMAEKIDGLMTIPDKALVISGDCQYKFSTGWDWFVETVGDKITTKDITMTNNMFYRSSLVSIPFDINIRNDISDMSYTFNYAEKLEDIPYIVGSERKLPTSAYSGTINIASLFSNCANLRYIPEDYFWKMVPNKDFWEKQANLSSQGQTGIFGYCYSLRELPDISMIGGNWDSSYSSMYYNLIQFCYNLNKATDIPVYGTFSSNAMDNIFYNNYRLKDFTFATNEDGTSKTANWKNQTISFTDKASVGYGNYSPGHNAGITADKKVIDDATYQALKDDPDWWTTDVNYSRYNHDSAVNTINSLPDCSATGTNTIKFRGNAGALTDGGAINTLTEVEIAVAAAKGWTVSFV